MDLIVNLLLLLIVVLLNIDADKNGGKRWW
jgi:hypothetical protein